MLVALKMRPHRFSQLAARIGGVSEKMLSQTLRALARDGLVRRTVTPTVPIQVTYELTALGADLMPRLMGLVTWVDHHAGTIQAAQAAYDADTPSRPPWRTGTEAARTEGAPRRVTERGPGPAQSAGGRSSRSR